ncbi:hypothetical protein KVR01_002604 [Diaporthe batatas]|uniref:uncharacterized protein n=1 Tax=Diaporthe batatas TaxID=748121 RepID=UPI001D051F89|nr:uncharacterized protein KVR01_002604 [Diaporthe batatas]KAG8166915.1 hypothetical protein KVR01_002604 [Diaporthe batatas]
MPKKRHTNRFSKPQSTAPASLASSSTSATGNDDHHRPSVNQLLASLRRTRLNSSDQQTSAHVANIAGPSVPPQIRQILLPGVPEAPGPPPRRRPRFAPRFDAQGRRLPAGPPPPRSWLSLSRHAPSLESNGHHAGAYEQRLLPGLYRPGERSLMDVALRSMALDWEYQRSYNLYYIYNLPDRVRMALIHYVNTMYEPGLSLLDLKIILLPQAPEDDDGNGAATEPPPSPSSLNEGITHLDLSMSTERAIKLRELSNFLFPSNPDGDGPLLDSWDAPESTAIPRPLLVNLTHLSLAASPETSKLCSWKQLLAFSSHLPTLTHLSLAYWPIPSLTPNATFAKVVSAQGQSFQYGGRNPYSHTLDDDWSEAILVLRKLSKSLYGLEYLDLTGCGAWEKALTAHAHGPDDEIDMIDWAGDWGKIETIILTAGHTAQAAVEAGKLAEYEKLISEARLTERIIRARRAGKGRPITVEADPDLDL